MKIRSLLLGTVAAAGLSTAAFATDLGVETGLDVCDDLGLTGLTISSDTNCLQISGSVKYEFVWGDYEDGGGDGLILLDQFSLVNDDNEDYSVINSDGFLDHSSSLDAWLKFVATADSSFGPASATIKWDLDANTISQLYVSIGEGTVITAGRADSIFKDGNDEPLNFLGLFHSGAVDAGVIDADDQSDFDGTGGEVLQVVSSMDNFWVGGALENIAGSGTLVGVVAYNTDDVKAHASLAVDEALTGGFDQWVFHSGFEGTFDTVKIVAAYGANNDNGGAESNGLISASVDLDNFVLAGSAEFAQRTAGLGGTEWGYGASIATEVSDGVTVKLGYRHFTDNDSLTDTLDQVAGQVVAAVSDEVTITGEAGLIMSGVGSTNGANSVYYGSGKVEWSPGGDFKASVKGEANNLGAYKITTDLEKSF